jgi:zinc transport system ATP-binding protein
MKPQIEVSDLSVNLEGATVLEQVSFSLAQGQFLAVLGGNGSGKTTLLRALLGLIPTSGGIFELGTINVAYMPQRLPNSGSVPVSVGEFAAAGAVRGLHVSSARQSPQTALEAVGLWPLRDRALDSLSGGQQRLVMFARALVSGAELLMLDEPSAGVDVSHQSDLLGVLSLLKTQGVTLIYVTHELDLIEKLVDKVLVLKRTKGSSVQYFGSLPLPGHLDTDIHHHHDERELELGAELGVAHADLGVGTRAD